MKLAAQIGQLALPTLKKRAGLAVRAEIVINERDHFAELVSQGGNLALHGVRPDPNGGSSSGMLPLILPQGQHDRMVIAVNRVA